MRMNQFLKKINMKACAALSSILALVLAGIISMPQKAQAVFGVGDVTFTTLTSVIDPATLAFYTASQAFYTATGVVQQKQLTAPSIWDIARKEGVEPALAAAAKTLAKNLILQLTEATVNWINSGFQGNPAFVADPADFLAQTADQTVGQFLMESSDLRFLCAPFQAQVKIALGLGYSQPFYKSISCTLTGAITNVQNAVNSFTSAGGWQNWIQITQPQNNPVGAFLLAKSELDSQIEGRKAAASAELNFGQGALSYKDCTDTTYDTTGNVVSTKRYSGSNFFSATASGSGRGTNQTVKTSCKVTTPGKVVVDMLGFKATSDLRQLELEAALGNGIDTVLSSLANALLTKGLQAIQNGILGDNSSANNQYNTQLGTTIGQIPTNYNNQLVNIANATSSLYFGDQFNAYNSLYGNGFGQSFSNVNTGPGTPYDGGNINDPYARERGTAINSINNLENYEATYQNAYLTATNVLSSGRGVFVGARNCNAAYSDPNSALRALQIDANVVTNIDGTPNSDRNVAQIPWNLTDIGNLVAVSNQHVALLDTARTAVAAASSTDAINLAMLPVNSTAFNTSNPTNVITNIKTWMTGMQNNYSTSACPINLTATFQITGPASSTPTGN